MPPDATDSGSTPRLSIVVLAGDYERVHYALIMASGAAAVGTPVTLFFTMGGVRALLADRGWRSLRPGEHGDPEARDTGFQRRGIAGFDELMESCGAMGVRFMVCETGLRAEDVGADQLRDDLPVEIGGVVGFLADAGPRGRLLFV
ncbi:MAG: DsrE/DsrF/DrsH-like family protein [Acetobacterales bacterium]